jgi:hypothetical protein
MWCNWPIGLNGLDKMDESSEVDSAELEIRSNCVPPKVGQCDSELEFEVRRAIGASREDLVVSRAAQTAVAFRGGDVLASTLGDIFPAIALVIHLRCASAGSAGAGRAIIMPFHRDAIAFVHGRLRRDRTRRSGRSKQREGSSEGGGGDLGFGGHDEFPCMDESRFLARETNFACFPARRHGTVFLQFLLRRRACGRYAGPRIFPMTKT